LKEQLTSLQEKLANRKSADMEEIQEVDEEKEDEE
jgi:hypothetical protein